MSSARTPARAGFGEVLVCPWLACIYLLRSTDGGCVARQHRSAATGGGRRTRQRGGVQHGGWRGFLTPPLNRHLGVCRPPPVAALRCRQPARPLVPVSVKCWSAHGWHAYISFAAPMVDASPNNIGAQRLAEGGAPASGAGPAKAERATPDLVTTLSINWSLTPINSRVRQNRPDPPGAVPPLFVHTHWRCPHDS